MRNTKLPTMKELKDEARKLRSQNPEITSHNAALDLVSHKYGYKNWKTIRPLLQNKEEIFEDNNLPIFQVFKKEAKELSFLDPSISSYDAALDALAVLYGYKNWKHIRPYLKGKE